ncbi:replicative DNA helicase [Acidovorax temperans]|uniref:replicative DNA helicase n=1 Tax=Acidovorax temperans TaxID=80878 RepID=UPI0005C9BBD4|nr:DnaB-like helicase C-terminal domain-containing protein [Acidovorax temperans]
MRERHFPSSPESEAGILSGLMLDSEAINRVPELVAEAFHNETHAAIFRAIQSLAVAGQPFDSVSVYTELKHSGHAVDLIELNEIAQYVPSASSIRRHASVVMEAYRLRQLMEAGAEIADLAFVPGSKAAEQIDKAQMMLAKLVTVKSSREPQDINESLTDYLALLQDLSDGKNPAMATGIGGLDEILNGGLRTGEMLVLGARPKHGKTALALAIARFMARRNKVLYLSQEMPVSQLMHRHTAAASSVDLSRILKADPADGAMWDAVGEAARTLGELNLYHDDQCALSLIDIRRKVLQVRRRASGLDVLVVDFLQLMAGAGEESRNRELDVIVNGIKALALDLGMAVIVLSQMSREADKHYGRPLMTHLRDSGAIEAAADQIALLFTDWAHPMSKRLPAFEGYSELEIVAHRNGPQGLVPLHFIGRYQQIGDWMGEIPKRLAEPEKPMVRRSPAGL